MVLESSNCNHKQIVELSTFNSKIDETKYFVPANFLRFFTITNESETKSWSRQSIFIARLMKQNISYPQTSSDFSLSQTNRKPNHGVEIQ